MGTNFASVVEVVGKNVSALKVNDKVFGFTDTGLKSQAEYQLMQPNGIISIMPSNIDYKKAAASLEGAHYAYTFIQKATIRSGQRILINGATGGIGSALLQFIRQYDVKITAACNTKNIDLIRSLGADKICDYTREDFTRDKEKYDYLFDAVGKNTFGKCKHLLKDKGVYRSSELGP